MLLTMAVVVLKVVALIFQRIERFIFNLPPRPATAHELIDVTLAYPQVRHPTEVLHLVLADLPILDEMDPHVRSRCIERVVYDLFREFSQPTLKHRSLFCCLSSREQIPERLTALLTLKHPDVPLLAPHLLMKALQEVRRPDEPPERLGKRDRQVG